MIPGRGKKATLEVEINCTWNSQGDAEQATADQLQDDCQGWPYVSRSPLPLSLKALSPLIVRGGWSAFEQAPALPSQQVTATKIKQTFLSATLASLLPFELQTAGPGFQ